MRTPLIAAALLLFVAPWPIKARERYLHSDYIIKNSGRFDGKIVRVSGYLVYGPEAHGLWPSKKLYMAFKRSIYSTRKQTLDSNRLCISIINPNALPKEYFDRKISVTLTVKIFKDYFGSEKFDPWGCNDKVGAEIIIGAR